MKKLENKVAIITGGAMGNGLGIAKVFLSYGARVAIFDYDDKTGTTVEELKKEYPESQVVGFKLDIRDKENCDKLCRRSCKKVGTYRCVSQQCRSLSIGDFRRDER